MSLIDDIIFEYNNLEKELRLSLSTMERKSKIYEIKQSIFNLQRKCPHYDETHEFDLIDGKCVYCGKQLEVDRNDKGY